MVPGFEGPPAGPCASCGRPAILHELGLDLAAALPVSPKLLGATAEILLCARIALTQVRPFDGRAGRSCGRSPVMLFTGMHVPPLLSKVCVCAGCSCGVLPGPMRCCVLPPSAGTSLGRRSSSSSSSSGGKVVAARKKVKRKARKDTAAAAVVRSPPLFLYIYPTGRVQLAMQS